MDLDSLKKVWNETQIELPSVSDDKILSILKSKGKTALSKLFIWELVGIIVLLSLIIIPLINKKVLDIFDHSKASMLFIGVFIALSCVWQAYKILILKRANLANNSILTSSKYICRYKLCINIEVFISVIFISVFITLFFYPLLESISESKRYLLYAIIATWIIVTILLLYVVYKKFYQKQIQQIEDSIREIQEFEKDN